MTKLFIFLAVAILTVGPVHAQQEKTGTQKAELITGASTGLGRAMAELIASNLFRLNANIRPTV